MSQRTEQEYRELAKRAYAALGRLPNVHSVGTGGREKAGQPTGELVIKVFVSTKRPLSELSPSERVPTQFEGVPTDVVECPDSEPDQVHPPGALPGRETDSERYRPLRGGTHLQGDNANGGGTLGFIAITDEPSGRRVFAVTNYHVLFGASNPAIADLEVGQPDTEGSMTGCCSGTFGKFRFGHYDADVDAAVVELDAGTEYFADVHEIGVLTGMHTITQAEAQPMTYQVRKRGIRTLLTGGTVQAINVVGSSGGRAFSNGIRVRPNPDPNLPAAFVRFANSGDSGSAYVNDAAEVVGLHFASAKSGLQNGWGTGFPIADLFQKFVTQNGLDLRVATNTGPGIPLKVGGAPAAAADVRINAALDGELSKTANGRMLTTLWLRHGGEALRLINSNKRAAAIWHLNQGPAVLNSLIRLRSNRRVSLPNEFDGKNVDECVRNIFSIFAKYGTDELREAALSCRAHFPSVAGRSYDEIVGALEDAQVDPRRGPE